MPAKRLKVFQARLGFYDTIVAAPSQKAALAAWGASPGEFAKGFASATTDPDAVEQALAQPGTVLKRPIGSKGRFQRDAAPLPAPKTTRTQRQTAAKAESLRKRREAQERRTAERELKEARQQERREMMELREREAALEKDKAALRERTEQRISRAKARLAGSRR